MFLVVLGYPERIVFSTPFFNLLTTTLSERGLPLPSLRTQVNIHIFVFILDGYLKG